MTEKSESAQPADPLAGPALSVLQARMDKCTTEQFWAITTFATFSLGVIAKPIRDSLEGTFPEWLIVFLVLLVGTFSLLYLVDRHLEYTRMWHSMARFLQGRSVPDAFGFRAQSPSRRPGLSGVTLYSWYILLISAITQSVYGMPLALVVGSMVAMGLIARTYRRWAEEENKPDAKRVYLARRQSGGVADA